MVHKITIWNPKTELQELEEKVARLKESEEVEDHILLVPKAALKEAGWEEDLIEEAIERGRAKAKGEEIGEPSWEDFERETGGSADEEMSASPEIPGLETSEEEQAKPGRVFNLLGDMGGEESKEQEEVREEELEESPFLEEDEETREEYNQRMFDEFFGPIKKEEAMETEVTKENLTEKMALHLADSRKRVTVGDETGWLCQECNSVWSLEQQICPNRCKKAEPPTVESRAWPKEEGSGLVADVRFPEKEADPKSLMKYDTSVLRKHMEEYLNMGDKSLKEKKELMADKMKEALGISRLPGEPEPCPFCGAQDGDECGCCSVCEEGAGKCKCCEHCQDHPCICDVTEECPICDKRIQIGEACPTGCDADMIELTKLYEEVKSSTELSFEEKVKYMTLLREKMKAIEGEDDENGVEEGPFEEPEDDHDEEMGD